eukprot:3444897-Amphidinium_carterae.1
MTATNRSSAHKGCVACLSASENYLLEVTRNSLDMNFIAICFIILPYCPVLDLAIQCHSWGISSPCTPTSARLLRRPDTQRSESPTRYRDWKAKV